jgi:hypothetical protein
MSGWMKRIDAQETQGQGSRLCKVFETDRKLSDFNSTAADDGTIWQKQQLFNPKFSLNFSEQTFVNFYIGIWESSLSGQQKGTMIC